MDSPGCGCCPPNTCVRTTSAARWPSVLGLGTTLWVYCAGRARGAVCSGAWLWVCATAGGRGAARGHGGGGVPGDPLPARRLPHAAGDAAPHAAGAHQQAALPSVCQARKHAQDPLSLSSMLAHASRRLSPKSKAKQITAGLHRLLVACCCCNVFHCCSTRWPWRLGATCLRRPARSGCPPAAVWAVAAAAAAPAASDATSGAMSWRLM